MASSDGVTGRHDVAVRFADPRVFGWSQKWIISNLWTLPSSLTRSCCS
jgi:hypothetical protein